MSPSVSYLRDRPGRRDPHYNCSCSNCDFDVDETLMPVFVSDPAGTAVRLRELYRDRVRGALNVELQNYLYILLELLAFPRDGILTFPYDDNVIPEIDRARVLRVIEEYQIPSFLVEVLSHDDFWREKLIFVVNVLDIIYRVFVIFFHSPSAVDSHIMALASAFCDSILRGRSWFEAECAIKLAVPYQRVETHIRDYLVPPILVLMSGEPFEATPGLQEVSFLYWILCPILEDPQRMSPNLSAIMLQFGLAGRHEHQLSDPELRDALCAPVAQDLILAYGAELYLRQVATTMRNPAFSNCAAHEHFFTMTIMSIVNHTALIKCAALSEVVATILDIIAQPALRNVRKREQCVVFGFLRLCKDIIPPAQSNPDVWPAVLAVTRQGRLFEVMSRALCICASELPAAGSHSLYGICQETLDGVATWALVLNTHKAKDSLRKAMRGVLRRSWYPTLQVLRATRAYSKIVNNHDRLIQCWRELGDALRFKEEGRAAGPQQPEQLCAWRGCIQHYEPSSGTLATCKGCGEARYCDRSCQRLDWNNGHRQRCKRIGW